MTVYKEDSIINARMLNNPYSFKNIKGTVSAIRRPYSVLSFFRKICFTNIKKFVFYRNERKCLGLKKCFSLVFITGLGFLLVACGNGNEGNNNEKGTGETEDNEENGVDDENQDQEAVEIIESAIEIHEETNSYFEHMVNDSDDEESFSETETWYIDDEGSESFRQDAMTEEEESTTTTYTAIENGEAQMYHEEETTLYEYDEDVGARGDSQDLYAQTLNSHLDDSEITLEGEDNVNGYDAYHITFDDGDMETEFWFDQETHYRVQEQVVEDEVTTVSAIHDYELDITYEEEIFQLDDVVPDEAETLEEEPNTQ